MREYSCCVFIAELSQSRRSNDRPKFVLLLLDPPIIKLYNLIITQVPGAALDYGASAAEERKQIRSTGNYQYAY